MILYFLNVRFLSRRNPQRRSSRWLFIVRWTTIHTGEKKRRAVCWLLIWLSSRLASPVEIERTSFPRPARGAFCVVLHSVVRCYNNTAVKKYTCTAVKITSQCNTVTFRMIYDNVISYIWYETWINLKPAERTLTLCARRDGSGLKLKGVG